MLDQAAWKRWVASRLSSNVYARSRNSQTLPKYLLLDANPGMYLRDGSAPLGSGSACGIPEFFASGGDSYPQASISNQAESNSHDVNPANEILLSQTPGPHWD
jgi:hypothetical protein